MQHIRGTKIEKLGFTPHKLGDLIVHEGPLLAHFIDQEVPQNQFLYKWVDADNKANRWLVARITNNDLRRFFQKEINLRELLLIHAFVFLIDLDDDLDLINSIIVNNKNIPDEYLPTTQSFFDEKHYEDYALLLKKQVLQSELTAKAA